MEVSNSWDSLRREARRLESELDEQINSYRQLVSAKVSMGDGATESHLEPGIDQLLKQLAQTISLMQAWVSSVGSDMVSHTLARHQDIFQDLSQEFQRLRTTLKAKQERASLLEDFREFDRSVSGLEDVFDYSERVILRENVALNHSNSQVDFVISQAHGTLGALALHRSYFDAISSKISNISDRLPSVNQIMASIRRKKSTDTIVLAFVASACTFLIFIYWMRK